jgi:glycerol 2-dehydrogenase (NADP+)
VHIKFSLAFQLEIHLYNPQHKLVQYLTSQSIVAQAYSPLGSTNSPLFTDETVVTLSKKYDVDAAAVLAGYLGTSRSPNANAPVHCTHLS